MKIRNLYITISLLISSYVFGQPNLNSSLPFENNDITVEKIMAGMVMLVVYFIPAIISRDKISWKYIFIFNLLTAWTVIGWFISFAWAINAKSKTIEKKKRKKEKKKNII